MSDVQLGNFEGVEHLSRTRQDTAHAPGIMSSDELRDSQLIVFDYSDGSGWFKNGLVPISLPTPHPSTMSLPANSWHARERHSQPGANQSVTFFANNEITKPTQRSPTYKVVASGGSRYYRCECGHRTVRKGDMVRHHESLRHQQRKYKCSCGAEFTRKFGVKRHKARCEKQDAGR